MITKPQYQELLEKIATREPHGDDAYWENPVGMLDVFDKIRALCISANGARGDDPTKDMDEVLRLWFFCGMRKSIQQIEKESGWEVKEYKTDGKEEISITWHSGEKTKIEVIEKLKSPEANTLIECLYNLFIKSSQAPTSLQSSE